MTSPNFCLKIRCPYDYELSLIQPLVFGKEELKCLKLGSFDLLLNPSYFPELEEVKALPGLTTFRTDYARPWRDSMDWDVMRE